MKFEKFQIMINNTWFKVNVPEQFQEQPSYDHLRNVLKSHYEDNVFQFLDESRPLNICSFEEIPF